MVAEASRNLTERGTISIPRKKKQQGMGVSVQRPGKADLLVFQTVNTRWSKAKAAGRLARRPAARLLLDFPPETEAHFRRVHRGKPWPEALDEMEEKGLVRAPEESQEYRALEPLMSDLPSLAKDVACAGDSQGRTFGAEVSARLVVLTLRGRMGSVETEEWRRALTDDLLLARDGGKKQAKTVALWVEERGEVVALDLPAETLEELKRTGVEAEQVVLDSPGLPLDELRGLLRKEVESGEAVADETVARLVREHLEFVGRATVVGYEEAYRERAAAQPKRG